MRFFSTQELAFHHGINMKHARGGCGAGIKGGYCFILITAIMRNLIMHRVDTATYLNVKLVHPYRMWLALEHSVHVFTLSLIMHRVATHVKTCTLCSNAGYFAFT